MDDTHPLANWIDAAKMKRAEFARVVGISPSHLTLILKGRRGVSLDLAFRIEAQTKHGVSAAQIASHGGVRRLSAAE